MAVFNWSGSLPGFKQEITSAQLTSRFGDIKTYLNTFNPGGLTLPTTPTAGTVLFANGATFALTAAGISGQILQSAGTGTPIWTSLNENPLTSQTSNFTATAGGSYIIGSSVTTVTLPTSPAVGNVINLYPGNGTNLTAVSIIQAASGERINGSNATFVLPNDKTAYSIVCVNTTSTGDGWIVIARPFSRQTPIDLSICDLRLSLVTATPITTTDQTAKTTLYATLYKGNRVTLYNTITAEWETYVTPEVSAAVPSNASTLNDVYLSANPSTGAVTMSFDAWSTSTAGTASRSPNFTLSYQDGVLVKTGDASKRYIGTIMTTAASGQTQMTSGSCLVWNYYNRMLVRLYCIDPTASWDYTTAAYRAANASNAVGVARVELISGAIENITRAFNNCQVANSGTAPKGIGIGLNSTSSDSATVAIVQTSGGGSYSIAHAEYGAYLPLGYNYISRLEISAASGTTTWYGTSTDTGNIKSGMEVLAWA